MKYIGRNRLLKYPERVGDHVPVFSSETARNTYYTNSDHGSPVMNQMCVTQHSMNNDVGYQDFQVYRYDSTLPSWVKLVPATGQIHLRGSGSSLPNNSSWELNLKSAWRDSVYYGSTASTWLMLKRSGFYYFSASMQLLQYSTQTPLHINSTQRAFTEIQWRNGNGIQYMRSSILPNEDRCTVSGVIYVSQNNSASISRYAFQNTGNMVSANTTFFGCWLGDVLS